jgi:hypothetical protein
MRKHNYVVALAIVAMSAFSMSSVLRAQAKDDPHPRGGMMDMGPGMMGQTGHMMEDCNRMMQGSSAKPNEQWKESTPEPTDKGDKKR